MGGRDLTGQIEACTGDVSRPCVITRLLATVARRAKTFRSTPERVIYTWHCFAGGPDRLIAGDKP